MGGGGTQHLGTSCNTGWFSCVRVLGSVSMRSQPPPDSSGNTIGLEAIIRKALMGKYDEQADERSASNSGPPAAADPRTEEPYSLPGTDLDNTHTPTPILTHTLIHDVWQNRFEVARARVCVCVVGKSKSSGRSNGRKTKSPGPGLSGGERPSSVSSVHSEGDCNRRTPLTNRVWEDRPSSAGNHTPSTNVKILYAHRPLIYECATAHPRRCPISTSTECS